MLGTPLGSMYLVSLVLCSLAIEVSGAGAAMNTLEKNPTKQILNVLLSKPVRLRLPRSHSRVKHLEILEVRGIFKKIVECQSKRPDEEMMILDNNRKKKSIHLDEGKKFYYIGQTKLAGKRKNKMIITNRKPKNKTRKNILNSPLTRRNSKKHVEKHFRKARSKRPNKRLYSSKHKKPKVMKEQKEDEIYSEVTRKAPRSKRIELFTRLGRNKERARKRKTLDRRAKSSNKALGMTGVIPVYPNVERHQELIYSADGELAYEEPRTIRSELRGLQISANSNANRQPKEKVERFFMMVTTTVDGLKGSDLLTHATTTRTKISQQESVTSKQFHGSNNELESSESSFNATTVKPVILLTNRQNDIISNKVTPSINKIRADDNVLETTTHRQTPSWNNGVLEPTEVLPRSTAISSDSWIKTHLALQDTGSSIAGEQITILLPNNSVLQVESSGDSEGPVELVHKNNHMQSTDSNVLHPTGQKDGNITKLATDGIVEIHDSVFSPLEMAMNHGSGTMYCKPGYKYNGNACKSMCDMGDFYCQNGGQCVIVENLGAMCRCHQTNNLCYRGECCRLSLTPFQLICVIGSCCIFVSVFLGSISLLIRRMDIRAVSKSVRTRLWISTLMPSSRSSSFSHSAQSELTACSDYDSTDLSLFNHKKEVTYEGGILKCERTRL